MIETSPGASARPSALRRLANWLSAIYARLLAIEDTPHSIALGLAIGIFFGFTPLAGLKTLLSIGVAAMTRSNKIAAAISVTLHDVFLPLMPAIYWWEFKAGYWTLHGYWPRRGTFHHATFREFFKWTTFVTVGQPLLIGSFYLAIPSAVIVYFICRSLVRRARSKLRPNLMRAD